MGVSAGVQVTPWKWDGWVCYGCCEQEDLCMLNCLPLLTPVAEGLGL